MDQIPVKQTQYKSQIFDTAMGTMSGLLGAVGGLGAMGCVIAIGIITVLCACPSLLIFSVYVANAASH